jgi:hypothetical protein
VSRFTLGRINGLRRWWCVWCVHRLAFAEAEGATQRIPLFEYSNRIGGRLFTVTMPGLPDVKAEVGGKRRPTYSEYVGHEAYRVPTVAFRDSLMESATTHAALANDRQTALPAHAKCSWGEAKTLGAHTRTSKSTIIAVSKREASPARIPERMAAAASRKKAAVATVQNNCPGGIHFGTKLAVPEM